MASAPKGGPPRNKLVNGGADPGRVERRRPQPRTTGRPGYGAA
jgi:hypothetical protein